MGKIQPTKEALATIQKSFQTKAKNFKVIEQTSLIEPKSGQPIIFEAGGMILDNSKDQDIYISPKGQEQQLEFTEPFKKRIPFSNRTPQLERLSPSIQIEPGRLEKLKISKTRLLLALNAYLWTEPLSGPLAEYTGLLARGNKGSAQLLKHFLEGSGQDFMLTDEHIYSEGLISGIEQDLGTTIYDFIKENAQSKQIKNGIFQSEFRQAVSDTTFFMGTFGYRLEAKIDPNGNPTDFKISITDPYDWHNHVDVTDTPNITLTEKGLDKFTDIMHNIGLAGTDLTNKVAEMRAEPIHMTYEVIKGLNLTVDVDYDEDGNENSREFYLKVSDQLMQSYEAVGAQPFYVYGIGSWQKF
jgi:hypothetical protein